MGGPHPNAIRGPDANILLKLGVVLRLLAMLEF